MPTISNPTGTVPLDRVASAKTPVSASTFARTRSMNWASPTTSSAGLTSTGVVEHVARGLYRLADEEPTEHETVAAVCARVPNCRRLPANGARRLPDRDTASACGLDRDTPQGQTAPAAIPNPTGSVQRRRVELRRARHPIRWRSGPHNLTCAHGRRLFPL